MLCVGPESGMLGVKIPAATDLSRKKGMDISAAKRSAIGVSDTGPDHYKRMIRVIVGVARFRTMTVQWP